MKRLIYFILLLFPFLVQGQVVDVVVEDVVSADVTSVTFEGGYIAEYQAVYDAMVSPPPGNVAFQQNKMVRKLVADGVWTKLDIFYCYAQHTNDDGEALLDWKQPTGGSDVVTNGGFDTDSDWTKQAGWTITGGKAVATATTGSMFQTAVASGKTYQTTYTISEYSAGTIRIQIGNTNGTTRSANGTYTEILLSAGTGVLFDGLAEFTGKIDNVIVKEWTNATAYNSPTFTALEGFTGDGSSAYIDCNWNPSACGSQYTQNSGNGGIYIRNNIDENKYVFGVNDGSNYLRLQPRNSGNAAWSINDNGTNDTGANTDSRGLFIVNRTASDARAAYRNNSELANDSQASTGLPNKNVFVLATDNNGEAASYCTDQASFFCAGVELNNTDRTNLLNAIETYMDSNEKGVIESFPFLLLCIILIRKRHEKNLNNDILPLAA